MDMVAIFQGQWVAWNHLDKDGKITKVPINPKTGLYASVKSPETWGTIYRLVNIVVKMGLAYQLLSSSHQKEACKKVTIRS
jgi:hypothetical protein